MARTDDSSISFVLDGKELREADVFIAEHRQQCGHRREDALGVLHGIVSYTFTKTGIGDAVMVSCSCGAKKDVTDYDSW